MSQSIPIGQPPGISSKDLSRGLGFGFWKFPGGRAFDKSQDFVENEIETQKNSVVQIFTGENKKKQSKQVEFFTFFEVYLFFQ